jgi:hypothetical protein
MAHAATPCTDAMDQQVLDLCSSLRTEEASALGDPFASPTWGSHSLGSPTLHAWWSPTFGVHHQAQTQGVQGLFIPGTMSCPSPQNAGHALTNPTLQLTVMKDRPVAGWIAEHPTDRVANEAAVSTRHGGMCHMRMPEPTQTQTQNQMPSDSSCSVEMIPCDPLLVKRNSLFDGGYKAPAKDVECSPPAAPATDQRRERCPSAKRARPTQSSVSSYIDREQFRKCPRRSQRLSQVTCQPKVSMQERKGPLHMQPAAPPSKRLVPPVSKILEHKTKFKLNRGMRAVEAVHVQEKQIHNMMGAQPAACSKAKPSAKGTKEVDTTKMSKAEAGKRTHLPRPPGKLVRKRRAELQALVHVGHRIGVPEREIRAAYGNNPDVSKAIRSLYLQGLMVRCGGLGKKSSPYSYRLSNGALKRVSEWASELEADIVARSNEISHDATAEAPVANFPTKKKQRQGK